MVLDYSQVPRQTKRQIPCAAIHNLQQGKPLREGETLDQLRGHAAFIAMTDPKLANHADCIKCMLTSGFRTEMEIIETISWRHGCITKREDLSMIHTRHQQG